MESHDKPTPESQISTDTENDGAITSKPPTISNLESQSETDLELHVKTNEPEEVVKANEEDTRQDLHGKGNANDERKTDETPNGMEVVEVEEGNSAMLISIAGDPPVIDEEEDRYLCEDDESECTDDEENFESSEAEMGKGGAIAAETPESQIAIFEYNEDGLMRKSQLSLEERDLVRGEKEELESSGDEGETFQCQTCKKVCTTWASFRSHLKSHSNQNAFSCPLCPKTFQTKHFVERHVRTFHKKERPYICRFCGKGFSTEWYCQKHESHHEKGTGPRIAARDRTYNCSYCLKTFAKPRQLRMHESTHSGEKKYVCNVCGKSFCYSSSLLKHFKCMHSDKPASVCQFCNKIYSTEESLLKHNECHIGIDQFKCRKCGDIFNDMLTLKRHGRTVHFNETERPHECGDCGKCFTHKSVLDVHLRCHTGERPFDCPYCGKSFRQKSQLKTHERSHSLERPYLCETCGKSFAECGSLQRHERTHTGEKPFTCTVCQKSFSVSHVLARHMKTHSTSQVPSKSNEATSQDAEILALALKSFVQSMEKMQGARYSGEGPETSVAGITTDAQLGVVSKGPQDPLSLAVVSKDEMVTATSVAGQALTTTKLQTAQGPIEILSFAIEDEIHPIACTPDENSGVTTEGTHAENQMEAKKISEIKTVEMEVVNNISVSEQQGLDQSKSAYGLQVGVPDNFISPSIYENPNMEKIRNRYSRRPHKVDCVYIAPSQDDNEARNALMELSVGSGKESSTDDPKALAEDLVGSKNVDDPADESEATDDEVEEEVDDMEEEGDENVEESKENKEEKVFESLSIFQIYGNSMVCVRKVNMFEPKFHKKCTKCNKSFFSHGGYENHMKRHETGKEMRYMCQYCGRHFTAKLSLKAHEAIHTGETLYKCKYCPREFRNYSSHRIHTATHTGLKPYLCQFCNKPFAQLAHVQRHERTHTGQKPYACEFCEKSFAEWGTWQRHTRTHTGEKPYVCSTCGKGFIVKFALRRHLKTHRNDVGDRDKNLIYMASKEPEATATTVLQEDIVVTDQGPDETVVSTEQLQTTMVEEEEEVVHIESL